MRSHLELALLSLGVLLVSVSSSAQEHSAAPASNVQDVRTTVFNSHLNVSADALSTTISEIKDKSLPRNAAVPIYAAFLRVEVSRNKLAQALRAYLEASETGNIFTKSETNLSVVQAAHGLDSALSLLDSATRPYRLLLPHAVEATETYIGSKTAGNQSVVRVAEQERLFGLSIAETVALLDKLDQNTKSFEQAYVAFGTAILNTYGAEVIAEASRLAAKV